MCSFKIHKTLKEISELINGEVVGNGAIIITGVSGIKEAKDGDITFLANPKYFPLLEKTHASAVITARDIDKSAKPIIRTDNPSLAFAKIVSLIAPSEVTGPKGIHPTAILGKDVKLGPDVAIGPYTVIEDNVSIQDRTIIYSNCYIGHNTKIGKESVIYPNVSIRERIVIGDRVIIHSGTVIGSDGFGFATLEGLHHKIPQIGIVEIGDDVEIGANVTIDRARFDKTVIGNGTKIDNLVQIAHNVLIGKNCIMAAQVGISGSTVVGNNVALAGQVGIVGHISIGDNAIVMAQSGVNKSIPAQSAFWGYPAKPINTAKRVNAGMQNLPRLYHTVAELKKRIEELESKLKDK
ncbi:MAG: UDP-3-O-(3-hydroxymyristoyl)glucosamine N-acyltransferase [Candidatus Omnitrophica bacterium]|nr:UDP-3-O-(3-hydroxymyristoyl)glucosamine N-acyltransferase [Candidatus Omnitrophota bacterium]